MARRRKFGFYGPRLDKVREGNIGVEVTLTIGYVVSQLFRSSDIHFENKEKLAIPSNIVTLIDK